MQLHFTSDSSTKLISAKSLRIQVDGDECEYRFCGARPKWSILNIEHDANIFYSNGEHRHRCIAPSLEQRIRFNDDDKLPNSPTCPHRFILFSFFGLLAFLFIFHWRNPTVHVVRRAETPCSINYSILQIFTCILHMRRQSANLASSFSFIVFPLLSPLHLRTLIALRASVWPMPCRCVLFIHWVSFFACSLSRSRWSLLWHALAISRITCVRFLARVADLKWETRHETKNSSEFSVQQPLFSSQHVLCTNLTSVAWSTAAVAFKINSPITRFSWHHRAFLFIYSSKLSLNKLMPDTELQKFCA